MFCYGMEIHNLLNIERQDDIPRLQCPGHHKRFWHIFGMLTHIFLFVWCAYHINGLPTIDVYVHLSMYARLHWFVRQQLLCSQRSNVFPPLETTIAAKNRYHTHYLQYWKRSQNQQKTWNDLCCYCAARASNCKRTETWSSQLCS